MTRSSTSEIFTPYKEPEREFRSSRIHFKTLSLDELRSHDFNLFSDQKYSEEEVAETMAETMEQYMSKTQADYGLGRNKLISSITTWDGLITKILNKYCPPAQTVKKIEEINNFQQEPNENLYQAWVRFKELLMKCPQHYLTKMQEVILFYNGLGIPTRHILNSRGALPSKTAADAKVALQEMDEYSKNGTMEHLVRCEQCKGPHYTKDFPLKEEGKTLEEAYYTQFGGPFQVGGYRAATLGFYQRNNANPSYQEQRQSMKDTLSKFMSELEKRHEENSNWIKEIQASMDVAIRNQGASSKT
nr:hypothetical protein [Tanacetum cinerariifolium]